MEKRIENLIEYAQGIYHEKNGKELYNMYLEDIENVTPMEVFAIENEQLKLGLSPKEMVTYVNKLINVFYKSLSQFEWQKPEDGSFLYYLMEENKELKKRLDNLKAVIKEKDFDKNHDYIESALTELKEYNHHMVKLENILFPYLEKKRKRFNGLKIMWSLHDEVRSSIKVLLSSFNQNQVIVDDFNVEIGKLFFGLYGLIQKQELILFPVASQVIDKEEFEEMHEQSFEYPFVYITAPNKKTKSDKAVVRSFAKGNESMIHMQTGSLTFEQVEVMINTLPVDITYVDENDKVAFFSNPTERTFPRSVAIIGRDVRNCHPPESVHMVVSIINDFKNNIKNQENFWIQMKGMFILIQYFAVRSEEGKYLGTLEVSQEISDIQKLKGEKRLLD